MKKVLLLAVFISLFALSCAPIYIEKWEPQPTETPIPVIPAENPVIFALTDGESLQYYDGENFTTAYTGKIREAGKRALSIDNVLTYFDEYGKVDGSKWLPFVPDLIKAVNKPATRSETVYDDDVWMIEHMLPAEAYALGGLYRDYAIIFYNGEQITGLFDNQWNPSEIIVTGSGIIAAIDDNMAYHNINGADKIFFAADEGLAICNVVTTSRTGVFSDENGTRSENWGSNWLFNTRWQKAGDKWYGSFGYEWTFAEGLTENANIMQTMTDQLKYPVWFALEYNEKASIIPAGSRQENGEKVLYWIECNRGTLFRQVPSINQLQYVSRIFIGDGSRVYGSNQVFKVKPKWQSDKIYFHHEGKIKKHDPVAGTTEIFSEDKKLISWE